MRLAIAAVGLTVLAPCVLALSACNRDKPDEPPPGSDPAMVLGGVDLSKPVRVGGNEPFWSVTVTADGMLYEGVDRPDQQAENPGAQITGSVATWTTTTDQSVPLVITLTDTDCSDGMSDRTYPLSAQVKIGEEVLTGCAASVDFYLNTDENGQPKSAPPPATPAESSAPASVAESTPAPAAPVKK